MTKLGILDQAILKLEQAGIPPLYMAGAMVLDPEDSPYPLDAQVVADHVAAFMEEIPLMRQKVVQDKLRLGTMQLVDDPEFDLNDHITISSLPEPGGYDELTEHLGHFSSRAMDLEKPLWHYEIIEGLEGGKLAIATHLHHSILDGVGASRVLGGLMSAEPIKPRKPRNPDWSPDPEPKPLYLAASALIEQARRSFVDTPKYAYNNTLPLLKLAKQELSKRFGNSEEIDDTPKLVNPKPQRTSLNPPQASADKVVAYAEFSMVEIKALSKAYDCTVNDIALFMNSVALEKYFENIGEDIDFDLIAAMPLNTRAAGDDSAGNSVSLSRVNLHNTVPDPTTRLEAIRHDTRLIKASSSRPTNSDTKDSDKPSIDYGSLGGLFNPIVLDGLAYLITRFSVTEWAPAVVNLLITNVPGPPGELYCTGAKVVGNIPMAPFGGPIGLTATISSSGDIFSIGYHGCGEAIEDKELLISGVRDAFSILHANKTNKTGAKRTRKTTKSRARRKAPR